MKKLRYIPILILFIIFASGCATKTKEPVKKSPELENLILMAKPLVDDANNRFPMMVDRETRADKVILNDVAIEYYYTLVNVYKHKLNSELFKQKMETLIKRNNCRKGFLGTYLQSGGIIRHIYRDKNNKVVCTIVMTKDSCN